jgi:TPR repeat protein
MTRRKSCVAKAHAHDDRAVHLSGLYLLGFLMVVAFAAGPAQEKFNFVETRHGAEQGDAKAQYDLALMYVNSQGVAADEVEADKWFHKAADQGHVPAEYAVGLRYDYGPQNYTKALAWYYKAAEGDGEYAYAPFRLSLMYANAEGVARNDAEAFKWMHKSADWGYDLAQRHLAEMYFYGMGATKDYAEAAKWFRKAAEQGDVPSKYNLGEMYYKGQGIPQDYREAYKWLSLASTQHDKDVEKALSSLRWSTMTSAELAGMKKWLFSLATEHDKDAKNTLILLRSKMTPAQIADAKRRVAAWKPVPGKW